MVALPPLLWRRAALASAIVLSLGWSISPLTGGRRVLMAKLGRFISTRSLALNRTRGEEGGAHADRQTHSLRRRHDPVDEAESAIAAEGALEGLPAAAIAEAAFCNYTHLVASPQGVTWAGPWSAKRPSHRECALDAFEGERGRGLAQRCLERRHVVFIGDSLSRYQYLSLVHFLEYGTWEEPDAPGKSITYREGWGEDWNDFYRLSSEHLRGHEQCDCFRGRMPWVENRYYRHGGLSVTFVGWFGDIHPRGHVLQESRLTCKPGKCSSRHDWKARDIVHFLRELAVPQLQPQVVLINTGLWRTLDGHDLQRLVTAAKGLADQGVEVYWKSTTSRSSLAQWVDDATPGQAFLQAGLRVYDASIFTRPLRNDSTAYRDGTTHYSPWVYRGLNALLLSTLCH